MSKLSIVFVGIALLVLGYAPSTFCQGWASCTSYEDYLHWVGSASVTTRAKDIVVQGSYAYMACDSDDLRTVDISNPSYPVQVDTDYLSGSAQGVAVGVGYLFVADNTNLLVYSLADPANPQQVAMIPMSYSRQVTVVGNLIAVARQSVGVSVIDVSVPESPIVLGTVDTPGNAYSVAAVGDLVYVADFSQGLQVIDISVPANPSIIGWLPTAGNAYSVAVAGDEVLVGCSGAMQVVDVSDPAVPVLLSSSFLPTTAYDIWTDGSRAYIAGGGYGLISMDVSNPHYPSNIGSIDVYSSAYGLDVIGQSVFVADYSAGLLVVSSANDQAPPLVGRWTYGQNAIKVSGYADYALVLTGDGGFRALDCSYPAEPVLVSQLSTGSAQTDFAVEGQFAYLSIPGTGMRVVDLSDAEDLEYRGQLTDSTVREISATGRYAYLTSAAGLKVVDVSNPDAPVLLSTTPITYCNDVDSNGEIVVITGGDELTIVGVTNPAAPQVLGSIGGLGSVQDVILDGRHALVASGTSGLIVIDVSVPSFPVRVSTFDSPGTMRAISTSGSYVIVADGGSGIHVVDISNPAIPRPVGTVYGVGNAYDVSAQADFIFTAAYDGGLALTASPCPNLNMVTVSGFVGSLSDVGNVAGAHESGTAGFDSDIESISPPTPPGSYLSVSFYHPEWSGMLGDNYNSDFRTPYDLSSESREWPLRVESDQSGTVVLKFAPNFGSGSGWGPWLRDMTSGAVLNLFPDLSYSYEAIGAYGVPDVREFELVVGGQYGVPPLTPEQRDLAAGWSMVSIPLIPPSGQESWAEVLLDDAPGPVYMYTYGDNGDYEVRQGHDESELGEGLWVGTLVPFTWSMSGTPRLAEVIVPVHNGWNQVGYPLWISSGLSAVSVEHQGARYTYTEAAGLGIVAGAAFGYDSTLGTYDAVSNLETWHGYWVAAYEDSVSLVFDYTNAIAKNSGVKASQVKSNPSDWNLNIEATGAASSLTIGAKSTATDGFDAEYDLPFPPTPPGASTDIVSAFIRNPGWDSSTGIGFSSDYIGLDSQSYIWEIQLVGPMGSVAELSWDPERLPLAGDFELVSPISGEILVASLRSKSGCTVSLQDGQAVVHVRLNAYVTSLPDLPSEMSHISCSPNPFNPMTTFRYSIEMESAVEIRIYDVRGQLVDILVEGQKHVGTHLVKWDATDRRGQLLSSGIYLASLSIGGRTNGQIIKLSLIR